MGHDHHHPDELEEHPEGGEIDPQANLAPNPGWLILNSVGIDVGSTTSHVTFSKLFLERQGLSLSSRFVVVRRDVLHRTPSFSRLTATARPSTPKGFRPLSTEGTQRRVCYRPR